jgi:Spy/CpxP family protein refolding chaperone
MKQTAAMVSVVGVFLIGILVGALGMQVYHNNRPAPGPGGDPGMERRQMFAERLGRLLELTPGQREEIESIRQESRIRAEEMRREMAPVVREQMEDSRRRIMEVLTPEQQERLDQLGRRERRMVERFLLGERGRPDGPGRRRQPRP